MGLWRTGRILLVAAVGSAFAAGTAAGQSELAGFERIAEVAIPLDGREVTLSLPRAARPDDVRVVIEGSFRSSYNGTTYYPRGTDRDGSGSGPLVPYVRCRPETLALVSTHPQANRYVFRVPAGGAFPATVGAWVDVDRLVTELIIAPSAVRESLSGHLALELWRRPTYRGLYVLLGVAVLGALLGLAVVRLRRAPAADMSDVAAILRRIDRKYEPTVKAIGAQRANASELRSQLGRLRDGAQDLARQIKGFRAAASSVHPRKLDVEMGEIERQLEQATRDDVRHEIEATLAAKRKLKELLADTQATEARYVQRLAKIEAAIDTTHLRITSQEQRLADEAADKQAIDALTAELESLDEAIDELKVLDQH